MYELPVNRSKTCECGISVLMNKNYFDALENHKRTEKHRLMLELKESDPESHKLAQNKKTDKVRCKCGVMVCRWSIKKHCANCPSTARQRATSDYFSTTRNNKDFREQKSILSV